MIHCTKKCVVLLLPGFHWGTWCSATLEVCTCGWGWAQNPWDGWRRVSWRCRWVMQVKEEADPREMRSGALQELLLGCISVQRCQGWLQNRKEEHVNEIQCWHDAGRRLMCIGETFSLKRWGPLRRFCLQLWQTWAPAFIATTVAGSVAQHSQNMTNCCPRDELPPACASFFRMLCDRLCLSQHRFFLSSLQPIQSKSSQT